MKLSRGKTWAGQSTFLHLILDGKAVAAQSLWSFNTVQALRHMSPNRQKGSMCDEEGKGVLKAHAVLPKLYIFPFLQLGSFHRSRCVQAVIYDTFTCLGHSIVSVFLGFKNRSVWGREVEPAW